MKAVSTALFLLAAVMATPANASCIVPNVATAHVDNVERDGNLNHYRLAITLSNETNGAQASNTLQFVDIYKLHDRLDAIGVPPLRPGTTYKAFYTFTRSSDAGEGTTTVHLSMRMVQPACAAAPPTSITF